MSQTVVPKHNITVLSITVNRIFAIIVQANKGKIFRRFITVLRFKCVVKSFVAARPDGETSTTWSYIVDIADNAQMEWVSVCVTSS